MASLRGVHPYRPLSKRDDSDPDLDTLHEGVTPWMAAPLTSWLEPFFVQSGDYGSSLNLEFIEGLETTKRIRAPFDRNNVMRDVLARVQSEPSFGLDAVDYALYTLGDGAYAPEQIVSLARLLLQSGSAWRPTAVEDGDSTYWTLTRRDLDAAKLAISDVRAQDQRAGGFLADSWKAIASRNPQPSGATTKQSRRSRRPHSRSFPLRIQRPRSGPSFETWRRSLPSGSSR